MNFIYLDRLDSQTYKFINLYINKIFESQMQIGLLSLFLVISVLFCIGQGTNERSVFLLTHQWCRKCDKVIEIMQKIQLNFGKLHTGNNTLNVQFIHSYEDYHEPSRDESSQEVSDQSDSQSSPKIKQIHAKIKQKYNILPSEIPFPTIWLQCPSYNGMYQNELNYLELQYWINLHCFSKLPECSANGKDKNRKFATNDYQFKVSDLDFEKEHYNVVQLLQSRHPFVKLCLSSKDSTNNEAEKMVFPSNYNVEKVRALDSGPLFFSSFNHNIRNYLFNPLDEPQFKKLGIFIVFNSPSHPKVRQFIEMYKFISDLLHGNKQLHTNEGKLSTIFGFNSSHKQELESRYHQSSIKNYDIRSKQQVFKNIAFVSACYSDIKRDCVMKYEYSVDEDKGKQKDPNQKPNISRHEIPYSFMGTKKQNIQRLMEFGNVRNQFQSESQQFSTKNNIFQIVAFHFDRESQMIKGYEFDDVESSLGNSFLFWIENIYNHVFVYKGSRKFKENAHAQCLSSQLTHVISERNLTTIQQNIRINKMIQRVNLVRSKKDQIKFSTIVAEEQPEKMQFLQMSGLNKWKSEYFKFCVRDQNVRYLNFDKTIDQLSQIIQKTKTQQKVQQKSVQNQQSMQQL